MIEVKNVVKKYKKLKALDEASFTIKEGRVTCLLGINGVGKSTILKAIMGLIPINSGEILIDGYKLSPKVYNKLGFIPDISVYYPTMTIEESFNYMNIFYDNWDMDKAYRMLEYFKLTKERKIAELSKGNMARVKIIMGYCQKSKYLLMDEPFSGMDFFTREDFISAMTGEFSEEGQAIIISTHEIGEIENLADDVILLEDGRVVKQFSAEEIREEEGKSIMDVMREVYKNA
ncbi:ABC transporter ATP-binding protein [Inconstantimicrobium mannanitabidum]|uniref:Multidrug ABC transporter ATP-binding protein n=1 Tax=Inconstantimicrobium mannanitabidum TaxID=1604901 RepID=A0ACB5RGD1_9CLOT|nr:ABC transporter ATP-binding protein [Clostridium sp. TW13]GKX68109.1 multidrug ABC transporter ATP-binding protein [Clostridium sp. TW13]